jgi:hypothetical protein
MRKFLSILLVAALLFVTPCLAADVGPDARESKNGVISATAANGVTIIGKRHVLLANEGAKTVYLRVNSTSIATVSDFPLLAGRAIALDTSDTSVINNVRYICGGADVTSIYYLAWD